jgi:acyl-CoA dehydrogenase
MLMTQRSWIDAMRVLVYYNAFAIDMANASRDDGDKAAARAWQERADLLIPLSKSLCTDVGCEMTSLALQIHGGMGYVEETGAAQHFRDARIAPIYEGTNGIQATDLVGRKLDIRGGGVVTALLDEFAETARQLADVVELARFGGRLSEAIACTGVATNHLRALSGSDSRSVLAASGPYLRMLGTTVCGGLLARSALIASSRDDDFHRAKMVSARYFGEHILPTVAGLLPTIEAGGDDLFLLSPVQLS